MNQKGQGLVEYTLVVLFIAVLLFVAVRNTPIGSRLATQWSAVKSCVQLNAPCNLGGSGGGSNGNNGGGNGNGNNGNGNGNGGRP
jgi:Flp pilus assembly pilin Flp